MKSNNFGRLIYTKYSYDSDIINDYYKYFTIYIKNSNFINNHGIIFSKNSHIIFDNCKYLIY